LGLQQRELSQFIKTDSFLILKIKITKSTSLIIKRPLYLLHNEFPQLELRLPKPIPSISLPNIPSGYVLRTLNEEDKPFFISLLSKCGFSFTNDGIENILSLCLPNGCYLIEKLSTKSIVSTMMARHLSSPKYPFGGRIDWLATDPKFRKLGLGAICATAATKRLIDAKYENIWVTTDDERIGAIKTFLSIGFEPVMNNATKFRWNKVIKRIS
jgi:mycothiol synthase